MAAESLPHPLDLIDPSTPAGWDQYLYAPYSSAEKIAHLPTALPNRGPRLAQLQMLGDDRTDDRERVTQVLACLPPGPEYTGVRLLCLMELQYADAILEYVGYYCSDPVDRVYTAQAISWAAGSQGSWTLSIQTMFMAEALAEAYGMNYKYPGLIMQRIQLIAAHTGRTDMPTLLQLEQRADLKASSREYLGMLVVEGYLAEGYVLTAAEYVRSRGLEGTGYGAFVLAQLGELAPGAHASSADMYSALAWAILHPNDTHTLPPCTNEPESTYAELFRACQHAQDGRGGLVLRDPLWRKPLLRRDQALSLALVRWEACLSDSEAGQARAAAEDVRRILLSMPGRAEHLEYWRRARPAIFALMAYMPGLPFGIRQGVSDIPLLTGTEILYHGLGHAGQGGRSKGRADLFLSELGYGSPQHHSVAGRLQAKTRKDLQARYELVNLAWLIRMYRLIQSVCAPKRDPNCEWKAALIVLESMVTGRQPIDKIKESAIVEE